MFHISGSENSWSLPLLVVASGALEVSGDCHRDKPGSDYENETRAAGMSYIHIVLCPPGPRVAMDTEKGMLCIVALVVVFLRGSEGICIVCDCPARREKLPSALFSAIFCGQAA